jgi:hypothetical protein
MWESGERSAHLGISLTSAGTSRRLAREPQPHPVVGGVQRRLELGYAGLGCLRTLGPQEQRVPSVRHRLSLP